MKVNTTNIMGGVIAAAVIIGAVLFVMFHKPSTASSGHTWLPFKSYTLGFSLSYPSDVLVPEAGASTATSSINFPHIGKTTQGNADDGIRIAVENTDAKDVAAYMASIQTPSTPSPNRARLRG